MRAGRMTLAALVGVISMVGLMGCQTDAQTGALVGGLGGAALGQAIGGDTESTLIGTGVGAGAGYIVGNESDKAKTRQEMESIRAESNTQVVNVQNRNGSYTSVLLRREGTVWVGPNGERYTNFPSQEALQAMYGR